MKVDIKKIKPNPRNPRIIKDEKFAKLVKSIQDFPEMLEKRPLVCFTDIDGKYVVLGGNMRLKAANEVGLKQLPILLADDWTEEQKNEFLIKDNVGFGEWDWDSLANEWDAEKLDEWGLDVPIILDEDNELKDLSSTIDNLYRIEIVCKDEEHQENSYNKLIEEGYECRLLTL
jgi:ParB-like chromosome segregation protein Spo0J